MGDSIVFNYLDIPLKRLTSKGLDPQHFCQWRSMGFIQFDSCWAKYNFACMFANHISSFKSTLIWYYPLTSPPYLN